MAILLCELFSQYLKQLSKVDKSYDVHVAEQDLASIQERKSKAEHNWNQPKPLSVKVCHSDNGGTRHTIGLEWGGVSQMDSSPPIYLISF